MDDGNDPNPFSHPTNLGAFKAIGTDRRQRCKKQFEYLRCMKTMMSLRTMMTITKQFSINRSIDEKVELTRLVPMQFGARADHRDL